VEDITLKINYQEGLIRPHPKVIYLEKFKERIVVKDQQLQIKLKFLPIEGHKLVEVLQDKVTIMYRMLNLTRCRALMNKELALIQFHLSQ